MNYRADTPTKLTIVEDPVPAGMAPLEDDVGGGMSVSQATAILSANWKYSLAIFFSVVLVTAVVTKFMPRTYTAIATLMVNNASNDPLAEPSQASGGLLSNYVATQVELLESSEVLDAVIDRLKLADDPGYAAGNRGGPGGLREWVETKLRKNLEVTQGRAGSQLIYITAYSSNSAQAADIANAVAEAFTSQQDQRVNGPTSERAKRYTDELAELKRKVSVAQDAAMQFRNRSGTVDLDAKVDIDMDSLTNLERRLQEAKNALRANQAREAGNPEAIGQGAGSLALGNLREENARLRAHLAQLRITLGPNHPQVVEVKSQIDANNSSLSAALAAASKATTSDIASGVAVSGNEVASLEKAVAEQRQKVLEGRRFRDEGSKYQLELESAQAAYKRALDSYDQIMYVHSTNISLASRARPPVKADKPNPIKNLMVGTIVGLLLGIAVPFVIELLNRRVRCRDDLVRDFGIPVLAEFPEVRRAISPA